MNSIRADPVATGQAPAFGDLPATSPGGDRFAAAQRLSRSVAASFRESVGYRRAAAAFADCDEAMPAETIAARAIDLLGDGEWPGALLAPLIDALGGEDWFDPPFRANRDALRIGALLFDTPAVSISASVMSAEALAGLPAPKTVAMPGRLSIVRYWRGGGARMRRWQAAPVGEDFAAGTAPPCVTIAPVMLSDGMILRTDGRITGHILDGATSDIISLTAMIKAEAGPFTREYAIDGGALLRIAALDDRASRMQMLLALLRHSGRADAGACFDQATRDPAFFVRWQAMREWLALDVRGALPRLREMTGDPNAEIRAAATAMLAKVEARIACPA